MLATTRGIVLHQLKYSETSLIVKIYTELFGLQSYLVKGVRKKNPAVKQNLFSPLSLVEVVTHPKNTSVLHVAKEISCYQQLTGIGVDIRKTTLALFIDELLYKTIQNEAPDPKLFHFLWNTVFELDSEEINVADFHLYFMINLAEEYGFMPHNNFSKRNSIFNMQDGRFVESLPDHPYYVSEGLSKFFALLLEGKPDQSHNLSYPLRQQLLELLLAYFKLHLPSMGEMKSHKVLAELLKT